MTESLLVELLTEELPPKALRQLGESFAQTLRRELEERQLVEADSRLVWFATPRRLAARLSGVRSRSADRPFDEKLMPAKVGLGADGKPTPALLKKLSALGLDASAAAAVRTVSEGKLEMLYIARVASGQSLQVALQSALEEAIEKLPIPKVMSYQLADGLTTVRFVRPAHGIVALHGSQTIPVFALGLDAGRRTQGHRFLGETNIELQHAEEYEERLEKDGRVIADFEVRRSRIDGELRKQAAQLGASLGDYEGLLDEVTALVEWPVVYVAGFEPAFLSVPQECLILTMRTNQKYFPLFDAQGRLTERFLVVSNMATEDPSPIIRGNERVVRPRLADARFFFEQDRRQRLESRVPQLEQVVYHNRLGSQLQRVHRIRKLAAVIADHLHTDAALVERAAWLCKADLVTGMVGEFPELQGIMGRYYARHDGEPPAVADAIEQHYRPRFANDRLPDDNVGAAVALADKIDTLVGLFGIGQVPTGEKDPFGLRRHALGVLRILSEKQLPLDILQLLQLARSHFPRDLLADSAAADVHAFMLERLRGYLRDRGFAQDESDAVISQAPVRIDLVVPRVEAVRTFRALPEAESLAAANKRIRNILKKAPGTRATPDLALLQEPAEKALFRAVSQLLPQVDSLVGNEAYTDALRLLSGVRSEVDTFFDQVMVMTDDALTRDNRLALLAQLEGLLNRVADISKLAA